jgi:hypothetical protein
LDHTDELSFGGTAGLKGGLLLGAIGHFYSAPPSSLTIDTGGSSAGEIFQTDLDGDGQYGDLLPGYAPGSYMHQIKGKSLNQAINSFNSTYAGQLTPAGKALVTNGLFTEAQLVALGAVVPTLALQPANHPRNNPAFRTFDLNASYPLHLKFLGEGTRLIPTVAFYNLFNLANFGRVTGTVLDTADSSLPNYVNSTDSWANANTSLRTTRNSGTFDQGGPRSTEFSLKFEF